MGQKGEWLCRGTIECSHLDSMYLVFTVITVLLAYHFFEFSFAAFFAIPDNPNEESVKC